MNRFSPPMKSWGILAAAILAAAALPATGLAETLTIQADQPGVKISPTLFGLMTEEINYSYDGGLYGELIQTRFFQNPLRAFASGEAPPIPHWSALATGNAKADISRDNANPVNTTALSTSLHLNIASIGAGERAGVANDGYWGIPVRPATTYSASFYARSGDGFSGPLTVDIESADGKTIYATGTVNAVTGAWKKFTLPLTTAADVKETASARFVISTASKGSLWFNLVSLFPPTYKNHPNGNRADIMQLLADLHPTFLRFPGGNYVEGSDLPNHFDWKKTIGPIEDRPGHMSPWGYRSTDGLGLLEFCEWCEDLNMEPVLAVFAGYTLNRRAVPPEDYPAYAQDAVDEIEYVTGDASTKWGAQRAKDGHPAPFKLHYVEIGNEDPASAAAAYDARFTAFSDTIKAKYPELKTIATGTSARTRPYDVIDEHYYMNVNSALTTANRYDNTSRYDRNGPFKVFVGEWATRDNRPTAAFNAALSDAVFLSGLQRNSDVVIMSCYAPLFDNVSPADANDPKGQQWATDLIGYDTLHSFGGAAYYVQKLFYNNPGDETIPYSLAAGGQAQPQDLWAAVSKDAKTGEIILKLISRRASPASLDIALAGIAGTESKAAGWILQASPDDVNSVDAPTKVSPKEITVDNVSPKFTYKLPSGSLVVLRIKAK